MPTAAFKDFGLQLAAAFFNKTLQTQNKTAIVFGATSGDTGSAAIDACKEFELIKSFILIPEGSMSEIQRKQMTTRKIWKICKNQRTSRIKMHNLIKEDSNLESFFNYLFVEKNIN